MTGAPGPVKTDRSSAGLTKAGRARAHPNAAAKAASTAGSAISSTSLAPRA